MKKMTKKKKKCSVIYLICTHQAQNWYTWTSWTYGNHRRYFLLCQRKFGFFIGNS